MEDITVAELARLIDHSLLRPELTTETVNEGIALAARYQVATATVRPCDVYLAAEQLRGTSVGVSTVVGFPHGSQSTRTKAAEARELAELGADELDMVINIGWLRYGRDDDVLADIAAVVEIGKPVKVILENAYLTDQEKVRGCGLAERAGAAFVKTSTGFAPSGATMADLKLMRASVSSAVQIKAAGGVRTLDVMLKTVSIGVSRFGATATSAILDDLAARRSAEPVLRVNFHIGWPAFRPRAAPRDLGVERKRRASPRASFRPGRHPLRRGTVPAASSFSYGGAIPLIDRPFPL